jgi:hypothetical protein
LSGRHGEGAVLLRRIGIDYVRASTGHIRVIMPDSVLRSFDARRTYSILSDAQDFKEPAQVNISMGFNVEEHTSQMVAWLVPLGV